MNRYQRTFQRLRQCGECAFIPFAVAGDPDCKTSESICSTYIDSGADILELGYPFSDPVADGPVNQRAALRAIQGGLSHDSFFKLVASLRKKSDIPFGVLCYTNSVMHLGYKQFCDRAAQAGIDSILVADMPPEESAGFIECVNAAGMSTVFIVSELTPLERMRSICSLVTGFVYVVSRLGPTGVQSDVQSSVQTTLKRLRRATSAPLCVGFGLSTPEHVAQIKQAGADGAIVGSHLVSLIEKYSDNQTKLTSILAAQVAALKQATR